MAIHFHEEDLSGDVRFADGPIAVDTEAMGLVPGRDRLCLVQLSDGNGDEHLVRFKRGSDYAAPNLKALLSDPGRLKLYHFARFDIDHLQMIRTEQGNLALPVQDKESDIHGKRGIEGRFNPGDTALIIDDLITRGSSILETAELLEENGLKVKDVIVLIDREHGAAERLRRHNYNLISILKLDIMLNHYMSRGLISQETYHTCAEYLRSKQSENRSNSM